MLLLAVGEAVAGHNLRARLTGRRAGKPLEPIAVARMAALAKASSAAAAALGGLAAGFAIYVTGLLDKAVPRHDAYAAHGDRGRGHRPAVAGPSTWSAAAGPARPPEDRRPARRMTVRPTGGERRPRGPRGRGYADLPVRYRARTGTR